ncbi:MAG: AAA family ATPase [Moraxella sp.]
MFNEYTIDLTARAESGKSLTPGLGVMTKSAVPFKYCHAVPKNNPVLIGEPGVGKTAIAEGLAQKIVNGMCQKACAINAYYRLIWGTDSGAKFRGEFEERLKAVLNDLAKAKGKLFYSLMKFIPWSVRVKPMARWMRAICSNLC